MRLNLKLTLKLNLKVHLDSGKASFCGRAQNDLEFWSGKSVTWFELWLEFCAAVIEKSLENRPDVRKR